MGMGSRKGNPVVRLDDPFCPQVCDAFNCTNQTIITILVPFLVPVNPLIPFQKIDLVMPDKHLEIRQQAAFLHIRAGKMGDRFEGS